jgi:hypothetical protein
VQTHFWSFGPDVVVAQNRKFFARKDMEFVAEFLILNFLMKYVPLFVVSVAVVFVAVPAVANTVSVADHGAVSDGKTLNTAAIQATVDDCAGKGGGTVLVPCTM